MIIGTLFLCLVCSYFFVSFLIKAFHDDSDPLHKVLASVFFTLWTITMLEVIANIIGRSLLEIFYI